MVVIERVSGESKFVLATCCALTMSLMASAQISDHYMIAGTAVCTKDTGNPDSQGATVKFLCASTEGRALSGFVYIPKKDANRTQSYLYDRAGDNAIVLHLHGDPSANLLEPTKEKFETVVFQDEDDTSRSELPFNKVQAASLNRVRFAVFFSAPSLGVSVGDINRLAAEADGTGKAATATLPTGTLTVTAVGKTPSSIRLRQTENDLRVANKSVKLKDLKIGKGKTGLRESTSYYKIDEGVDVAKTFSWHGVVKNEEVDSTGLRSLTEFDVFVERFTTDETAINSQIDKVLSCIPEDTQVVSRYQVVHVWKDGRPVRRVDARAEARGREVRFANAWSGYRMLAIPAVLTILAGVFFMYRRARRP